MPQNLEDYYRYFEGTCYIHFRGTHGAGNTYHHVIANDLLDYTASHFIKFSYFIEYEEILEIDLELNKL
jgi:hypothetical protein